MIHFMISDSSFQFCMFLSKTIVIRGNACVCVCVCLRSNDVTLGPGWVVLKAVHGISLSNYLFCVSTDGGWPWPTSEVIWSLFRQEPIKTHLPGSPQSDWDPELLFNCEETGSDFQSHPIWLQPSAVHSNTVLIRGCNLTR